MRKFLLVAALCSAVVFGFASAPAQASGLPICGHNLKVLQASRCGPFQMELGFVTLKGHTLTVNGIIGNISNNTVRLVWPLPLVFFRWPNIHRVIVLPGATSSAVLVISLLPAWANPFQRTFAFPRGVHDLGILYRVGGTSKYFAFHVHV